MWRSKACSYLGVSSAKILLDSAFPYPFLLWDPAPAGLLLDTFGTLPGVIQQLQRLQVNGRIKQALWHGKGMHLYQQSWETQNCRQCYPVLSKAHFPKMCLEGMGSRSPARP